MAALAVMATVSSRVFIGIPLIVASAIGKMSGPCLAGVSTGTPWARKARAHTVIAPEAARSVARAVAACSRGDAKLAERRHVSTHGGPAGADRFGEVVDRWDGALLARFVEEAEDLAASAFADVGDAVVFGRFD